MIRRQWRTPHASIEGDYGLGVTSGTLGGWDWVRPWRWLAGLSRTCVLIDQELTISILTNAIDGCWDGR